MEQENFSLKDMIIEVRDDQKLNREDHIKMRATLENVEIILKKMAISDEDHEQRIQKVEGFQGKIMVVWGIAVVVFTTVINKVIANVSL
jgi:hypothetical protein